MSLTITINLPDDTIGDQTMLDQHLTHIGFKRRAFVVGTGTINVGQTATEVSDTPVTLTNTDRAGESEEQHAARRERGKPAPGRARRTKEEIAEDEAADKAEAANGTTQNISTGGERVGPEDDEATQAQDRADELAEEGKTEEPAMTMEQAVMAGKAAIGDYVKKFGMAAAQEDGMSVFIGALGDVPAGAKGWGWSMLAESGNLAGAIKAAKAWQAAASAAGRFGA